jgi:hypothetical protein
MDGPRRRARRYFAPVLTDVGLYEVWKTVQRVLTRAASLEGATDAMLWYGSGSVGIALPNVFSARDLPARRNRRWVPKLELNYVAGTPQSARRNTVRMGGPLKDFARKVKACLSHATRGKKIKSSQQNHEAPAAPPKTHQNLRKRVVGNVDPRLLAEVVSGHYRR